MSQSAPLFYKKALRFDIPGHVHFLTFSCYRRLPLLTNDLWRGWLAESHTHARETLDVALWAYVIMPEHVHLLVRPRREEYRIAEFLQMVKYPVARRAIKQLKENAAPLLAQLEVKNREEKIAHRFWQAGGGYDLNLWSMKKIIEKAEYCHHNPVARRLAKTSIDWRWSSVRWLERGLRESEPVKVDDWIGA